MSLDTIADATLWLTEHLDELPNVPTRIHDAAIGDDGAPRYSAAFWAYLTASPYAARDITETRTCNRGHGFGDDCAWCSGNLSYEVTRTVYVAPLAAALASLEKAPATSPQWPTPYLMVIAFMRSGFDLSRAAMSIGRSWRSADEKGTVEAAFILAVRKLAGRWASGPVERPRRLSDAQADAEAAA